MTVYDYSDDTAAKTDGIVESALKDAGETAKGLVSYRYVSFAAVDTGDGYEVREENLADYNSLDYLFFMTLEDYNRISGKNVSLRDDQVMVLADGRRYDRDTFSIFGRRYDVAGLKGQTVEDGMDAMGSVGSLHIVLPNFPSWRRWRKSRPRPTGRRNPDPFTMCLRRRRRQGGFCQTVQRFGGTVKWSGIDLPPRIRSHGAGVLFLPVRRAVLRRTVSGNAVRDGDGADYLLQADFRGLRG